MMSPVSHCSHLVLLGLCLLLSFVSAADKPFLDRYCSVSSLGIFDCFKEAPLDNNSRIEVTYEADYRKIFIRSKPKINVSRIAIGALGRLTEFKAVDKISMSGLVFDHLKKADFTGIATLLELNFDNPRDMDSDALTSVMATTKNPRVTMECNSGFRKLGFEQLRLVTNMFTLSTYNCFRKLNCYTCRTESNNEYHVIYDSGVATYRNEYILNNDKCTPRRDCSEKTPKKVAAVVTPAPVPAPAPAPANEPKKNNKVVESPPTQDVKSVDISNSSGSGNANGGNGLLWIVFVITTLNSVVIVCALIVLACWQRQISASSANKKHTIVLEDGDQNTKYMKISPYA